MRHLIAIIFLFSAVVVYAQPGMNSGSVPGDNNGDPTLLRERCFIDTSLYSLVDQTDSLLGSGDLIAFRTDEVQYQVFTIEEKVKLQSLQLLLRCRDGNCRPTLRIYEGDQGAAGPLVYEDNKSISPALVEHHPFFEGVVLEPGTYSFTVDRRNNARLEFVLIDSSAYAGGDYANPIYDMVFSIFVNGAREVRTYEYDPEDDYYTISGESFDLVEIDSTWIPCSEYMISEAVAAALSDSVITDIRDSELFIEFIRPRGDTAVLVRNDGEEFKIFQDCPPPTGEISSFAVVGDTAINIVEGVDTFSVNLPKEDHSIPLRTTVIGEGALDDVQVAQPADMVVIGYNAARQIDQSEGLVAIGSEVLENFVEGPNTKGVAIGYQTGQNIDYEFGSSSYNLIGYRAARQGDTRSNVVIGALAKEQGGMIQSVIIGNQAGQNVSGITNGGGTNSWRNVILGHQAGINLANTQRSVIMGYRSGYSSSAVTHNQSVLIGNEVGSNVSTSQELWIDNSNTTTPLLRGSFANDILTVNGDLTVTNDLALSSYGSGSRLAAPTFLLGVDASGNVIEHQDVDNAINDGDQDTFVDLVEDTNDRIRIFIDAINVATIEGSDIIMEQIGGGVILKSPDGTRWRITVDNTGALSTVTVP